MAPLASIASSSPDETKLSPLAGPSRSESSSANAVETDQCRLAAEPSGSSMLIVTTMAMPTTADASWQPSSSKGFHRSAGPGGTVLEALARSTASMREPAAVPAFWPRVAATSGLVDVRAGAH